MRIFDGHRSGTGAVLRANSSAPALDCTCSRNSDRPTFLVALPLLLRRPISCISASPFPPAHLLVLSLRLLLLVSRQRGMSPRSQSLRHSPRWNENLISCRVSGQRTFLLLRDPLLSRSLA